MKGIFNNPEVIYFKKGQPVHLQKQKSRVKREDEEKLKLMKRFVKMYVLQRQYRKKAMT